MRAFVGQHVVLFCVTAISAIWGSAIFTPAQGQSDPGDRIVFLYCTLRNDSILLQKSEIVPGRLKARRQDARAEFLYEVKLTSGEIVAQQTCAPPRHLHYDVPQPDGSLQGGSVPLLESDFVVRIPWQPHLDQIAFFRNAAQPSTGGALRRAAKGALVARFSLQQSGGDQ